MKFKINRKMRRAYLSFKNDYLWIEKSYGYFLVQTRKWEAFIWIKPNLYLKHWHITWTNWLSQLTATLPFMQLDLHKTWVD